MSDTLQARVASPTQIRAELEQLVRDDLFGPAGGADEILPPRTSPRERYLVGMLAPADQEVTPEALEELVVEGEGDEEPLDLTALGGRHLYPSSLGVSFALAPDCDEITVTVRWGQYFADREEQLENAKPQLLWRREPREYKLRVPTRPGQLRRLPLPAHGPDLPGVFLAGLIRCRGQVRTVSLFLVNGRPLPAQRKEQAWLFQVELEVAGALVARPRRESQGGLDDASWQEVLDEHRLYSHCRDFAAGHGTAVAVERDSDNPARAHALRTTAIGRSLVAQQSGPPPGELTGLVLEMETLAGLELGTFGSALLALPQAYEQWLNRRESEIAREFSADLHPSAGQAIARARATLNRLREGIELLDTEPLAARAFCFANRAMALQRTRVNPEENPRWHAFQLAFILLNLAGLTDPHHPDRNRTADLLFFPTGGGKTEAYLGLAAYTMALRRLHPDPGQRSGLAVLMRYTLRLLTLQQFQRAAALMCASESIRREDPARWGQEPFRLGLWVGGKVTPNRTEHAEEAVRRLKAAQGTSRLGNPLQLTRCPWCGSALGPEQLVVRSAKHDDGRTVLYCGDDSGRCPFTQRHSKDEGLPVVVVDDEIYRRLPAMIIATVDKFAQMPWNGAVGMLFGRVSGYCPRHGYVGPSLPDASFHPGKGKKPGIKQEPRGRLRPPDLIIQDELHLISGPLGSLAGLFEVAIEELCCWNDGERRVRPKVIASTATVRRAAQQVDLLFDRKVAVFPPPGLNVRDSFFARVDEALPGRLYLGVCAPGVRMKTALIRVYLSLLSAGQTLVDRHGAAADPWLTLVGYFNSLRELGGMRRLAEDQVTSRLRRVDVWNLATRMLFPERIEELTSRKSSSDIPKLLERLESPVLGGKRPIELLLATNMLSVGVDVQRLGLMVVAGQPKSTAEYIQATSRVGRSAAGPGMVLTVANWARPRDLSHYERFEHYHQTFYQQVEALSLTPFSSRAIDRGLTSVVVSLVRLWDLAYNANEQAFSLAPDDPIVREVVAALVRRSRGALSQQLVEERLAAWQQEIQRHRASKTRLGYREAADGVTVGLLKRPEDADWETWTALESLRDVEPCVNLVLTEVGRA